MSVAHLARRLFSFGRGPAEDLRADADVLILPLCREPLWQQTVSWSALLTVLLVTSSLFDLVPQLWRGEALRSETVVWSGMTCGWLALLALQLARRRWVRAFPMPPLTLGQRALQLPAHGESIRATEVAYKDLIAVGEATRLQVGLGPTRRPRARLHRRFILETERRVLYIDERWFAEADGAERFFAGLRARLADQAGLGERLLVTERMRRPALLALHAYPLACQMTIGLMVVLFLNSWAKGALEAPFGLLRWGAMAPSLAGRPSEAYRLISANFLHGHWLHMVMNGWALYYLGSLIERLLGPARYIVIMFASALAAMGASALHAGALLSVGASGAIFGLLGAFALMSRRLRRALPLGLRQPPRWWATLLVVNIALPLLWPVIDWAAHVAGFAAGVIAMALLLGRRRELPGEPTRRAHALAGVCVVLCALALIQAVARAAAANATQETKLAHALLHDPKTPASALGNLAWLWAIDPDADEEHLAAGSECAEEAIKRAPLEADLRVTLASLLHRRGRLADAVGQWASALEIRLEEPMHLDTEASAALAVQLAREALAEGEAARPQVGQLHREANGWILRPAATPAGPAAPSTFYLGLLDQERQLVAVARLLVETSANNPVPLPRELNSAIDAAGAVSGHALIQLVDGELPAAGAAVAAVRRPPPPSERHQTKWHLWRPPRFLQVMQGG